MKAKQKFIKEDNEQKKRKRIKILVIFLASSIKNVEPYPNVQKGI